MRMSLLSNEVRPLKRFIAILLFAATLLPFALPGLALAQDAGSGMPLCCRRIGVHGCAMSMGERDRMIRSAMLVETHTRRWQAPPARCPYTPAAGSSLHFGQFARPTEDLRFALAHFHPQGVVQTESRWRVARERSRQERGPPYPLAAPRYPGPFFSRLKL